MVDAAQFTEVIDQIMGRKPEPIDPDAHIADLIPDYARVQVPLKSRKALANCSDLLRGLATSLDLLSRRTDLSEVQALFLAHAEIKAANSKMQGFSRTQNLVRL